MDTNSMDSKRNPSSLGVIQRLCFFPDPEWKGSFAWKIEKTIEETSVKLDRVRHHLTVQEYDQLTSGIYKKSWRIVSREIIDKLGELQDNGNLPIEFEGYIITKNQEIRGVFDCYGFFDFYDPTCAFPFPEGFQEKFMEYAAQVTKKEVDNILKSLN